jgi:hypothetical protein
MSKLADSPAFPHFVPIKHEDDTDDFWPKPGMTLRQHFAGLAMQGFLASLTESEAQTFGTPDHVAQTSVAYADALLLALEKPAN